ncbi:Putative F-box/LRR-repeat protein At5g02700 [Linum perenne]
MNKLLIAADDCADRISSLPDGILHDILTRTECNKDAARTSILSRRWLAVWRSYPLLQFRRQDMKRTDGSDYDVDAFEEIVTSSLARICRHGRIQSFVIECPARSKSFELMDKWLATVMDNGAEMVYIDVEDDGFNEDEYQGYDEEEKEGTYYSIPNSIFSSPIQNTSPAFLTTLSLRICKFDKYPSTGRNNFRRLSSLRNLALVCVQSLTEQLFHDILASTPLLETLTASFSSGVKKIRVSGVPNLKDLTLDCYLQGEDTYFKAEVNAPSLETLYLYRCPKNHCKILTPCPNLKTLLHSESEYDGRHIHDDLIAHSPSLEHLSLSGRGVAMLSIQHDKLKYIQLDSWAWDMVEEVEIDCLSLVNVYYRNVYNIDIPKIQLVARDATDGSATSPRLLAHLGPCGRFRSQTIWFAELRVSFTGSSSHLHVLKLSVLKPKSGNEQKLVLNSAEVESNMIPLSSHPRLEHLKLTTDLSTLSCQRALLDGVLWRCHPDLLTIIWSDSVSGDSFSFFKFVFMEFMNNRAAKCCKEASSAMRRCWRHKLQGVKIIDRSNVSGIDHGQKDITEVAEDAISSFCGGVKVCFKLMWH